MRLWTAFALIPMKDFGVIDDKYKLETPNSSTAYYLSAVELFLHLG